jgi:hypothetical protein
LVIHVQQIAFLLLMVLSKNAFQIHTDREGALTMSNRFTRCNCLGLGKLDTSTGSATVLRQAQQPPPCVAFGGREEGKTAASPPFFLLPSRFEQIFDGRACRDPHW